MNTLYRLLALSVYPLSILLCLAFLLKRKNYRHTLIHRWKDILLNTLLFGIILSIGIIIFFQFEDAIYSYDYAGHYIRALTLKTEFARTPQNIFTDLYRSMNQDDYSYLPALMNLWSIILNESYGFYCLGNLWQFGVPVIFLGSLYFYTYTDGKKFLPLLAGLVLYPFYLTITFGKVDICGLFFLFSAYGLIILPKFEDITIADNLFINLLSFLCIFLRRWYLYSIVCLYLGYFIKWIFEDRKILHLLKMVLSGILLLGTVVFFFNEFLTNILTSNMEEAYEVYSKSGKIGSLINYISPAILLVCLLGAIRLAKKNMELLLTCLVSIVIPCYMVWKIQSFEYHHYLIFILNIGILFMSGILFVEKMEWKVLIPVFAVLFAQVGQIYCPVEFLPSKAFTSIRVSPEITYGKKEIRSFAYYLRSIETDDYMTAYLCGGSYGVISDDMIRNSLLPDLNTPSLDSAIFDLRDGFPRDFQYIRFVIICDPMVYTDKDYQHMFDVISYAITEDPLVSTFYTPIYTTEINGITLTVYEKTADFTPAVKQYFYDEMLKYYPDKTDFFAYILE